MKQFAKLLCIAALSVAAYGCGGPTTPTTPDTGGPIIHPDAGSNCTAAKKCGSDCCTANQECVGGACTDCECTTENWLCGTDSCNNNCGSCTNPKVCSAGTHTCVNSGELCPTPNTCPATTPTCNPADGACECTADSCGAGKTCNAAKKCETTTVSCNATTETACGTACCTNATEKCVAGQCATCGCGAKVCGEDACGNKCGTNNGNCTGTDKCNLNGACVPATQICDGITCAMTGEACDTADGKCYCTVGGTACGAGYECQNRKCTPVACAGLTCSAEQPCNTTSNKCECNSGSCTSPKTCNATTKACETPGACSGLSCTAELPCNSTTNKCECTTTSCGTGKTCNASTKVCETTTVNCTTTGCTGTPETPYCNTASGKCECQSGSCTAPKTCNAITKVCEGGGCSSCTQGETCNAATNSCECTVGSNTVRDSCFTANSGFTCDATTKLCKAAIVNCNGTNCLAGQVCADVNATDPFTGPNKACTCLPSLTTGFVDSCLYMGTACNVYTAPPFKCEKPSQFDECTTWGGCDTTYNPNLTCEGLGQGGNVYLCAQKCTATSACPGLTMSCQTGYSATSKICYYNQCGKPATPTGSPDRSKYFIPCAAAGASDGLCVPLWGSDSAQKPIDSGYCFQTGSAAENAPCDPFATRSQLTKVCAQGLFCDITRYDGDTAGTFTGVCRPVCNAATGGSTSPVTPAPVKNCTGTAHCRDNWLWEALYNVDLKTVYDDFKYSLLGFCAPGCDVLTGSPACAATNGAGDKLGCSLFDWSGATGAGTCEALQNTVATEGQACVDASGNLAPDDGSYKLNCEGGTFCASSTKTCVGFCSTATCASGVACSQCTPGTMTCGPAAAGAALGVCQ
ncbi:MAG TPA: hypothetical protein VGK67_11080 [Myxococcales bacterium]